MGPSGGHGGVYPPSLSGWCHVPPDTSHGRSGRLGSCRVGWLDRLADWLPRAGDMVDPRGRSGWWFDPARGRGSILNRRSVSNVEFACAASGCILSITGRVRHVAAVQTP